MSISAAIESWAVGEYAQHQPSMYLFEVREQPFYLHEALQRYSGACLDPRDKIYAILALVYPEQRIEVDYTKSTVEVFWATLDAVYVMRRLWQDLDLNGIAALLCAVRSMGLSEVVLEDAVRSRVETIYTREGWLWPPARNKQEADTRKELYAVWREGRRLEPIDDY